MRAFTTRGGRAERHGASAVHPLLHAYVKTFSMEQNNHEDGDARASTKRARHLVRGAAAFLACLLALLLLMPAQGIAQDADDISADRIRAAYILKFLEYVEWPATAFSDATAPYVIGVTEWDYVANELARLAPARTSGGRSIIVRRLAAGSGPAEVHAVYVGRRSASAARIAGAYAGKPVLTITDDEAALPQPGIINFLPVDRRVRFEISLASADKAGLRLSSRLLSVAVRVHKGELPGDTDLVRSRHRWPLHGRHLIALAGSPAHLRYSQALVFTR